MSNKNEMSPKENWAILMQAINCIHTKKGSP